MPNGWDSDSDCDASSTTSFDDVKTDIGKVWSWVYKLEEKPKEPVQYLHETEKCKIVVGLIEEGEKFGLHIGGLSCYANNSRKVAAGKLATSLCRQLGLKGSIAYCETSKFDSGKKWVEHNFKGDAVAFQEAKTEARKRGWNLYWMRDEKKTSDDGMKVSRNLLVVQAWFDDYKARLGDEKPTYDKFKDDLFEKFGAAVANLERSTKMMYDTWKPTAKRGWLAAALSELPNDSPLVKYARYEVNYNRAVRHLLKWTKTWQVYSEQNDYKKLKDTAFPACMRLYAVITILLTRTSARTNNLRVHGLWICGQKGIGKSLLSCYAAGIKTRRKKIAGDAKGVGRFKFNVFQEVCLVDDIRADLYRTQDYYQIINQLLDNTGTEAKVHSASVEITNKFVVLTSNERIATLDEEPEKEKKSEDECRDTTKKLAVQHPLRRRVLELYILSELEQETVEDLAKINDNEIYKEEGDKLAWKWYKEESRRHRFSNGCNEPKLVALQELLDAQSNKAYSNSSSSEEDE